MPKVARLAKGVLATVGYVQKAILVLMLIIDGRHQGSCIETQTRQNGTLKASARASPHCIALGEKTVTEKGPQRGGTLKLESYSPEGGRTLSTKTKMAFSASSLILFRMTNTNWPTVRSAGTKYLQDNMTSV